MANLRSSAAADAKRLKEIDKTIGEKQKKLEHLRKQCVTIFLTIKQLVGQHRYDEAEEMKIELTLIQEDVRNVKYDLVELEMDKQYLQEKYADQRNKKKATKMAGKPSDMELQVEKLLKKTEKSADIDAQMEKLALEGAQMENFQQKAGGRDPQRSRELVLLYKQLCDELEIPVDEDWLRSAF